MAEVGVMAEVGDVAEVGAVAEVVGEAVAEALFRAETQGEAASCG